MFGIGVPELVLILIIGLVVFGPGKLPEIGKAIGKSLNEFKKATSDISATEEAKPEIQQTAKTIDVKPEVPQTAKTIDVKPEEKK